MTDAFDASARNLDQDPNEFRILGVRKTLTKNTPHAETAGDIRKILNHEIDPMEER